MSNEHDGAVPFDDIHVDSQEASDAANPAIGTGTPDTAAWQEPATSWLRRQPVVALLIVALAPTVAALLAELAASNTDPYVAVLLAAVGTVLVTVGAWARSVVTPLERPRDATGIPLTPSDAIPPELSPGPSEDLYRPLGWSGPRGE